MFVRISRFNEPCRTWVGERGFTILGGGVGASQQQDRMLRLGIVPTSLSIRTAATVATMSALLFSCGKKPTETNSQAAVSGSTPVDYSLRVGVAVRTSSRTFAAIENGTVPGNSTVTLVLPLQEYGVNLGSYTGVVHSL